MISRHAFIFLLHILINIHIQGWSGCYLLLINIIIIMNCDWTGWEGWRVDSVQCSYVGMRGGCYNSAACHQQGRVVEVEVEVGHRSHFQSLPHVLEIQLD